MPKRPEGGKSALLARFTRPEHRTLQVEITTALYNDIESIARFIESGTGNKPSMDEMIETFLSNQVRIVSQTEPGYRDFVGGRKNKKSEAPPPEAAAGVATTA